MASSSASSASNFPPRKYDVFVSFKGEDTSENFIRDLYTALSKKQIKIFTDYQPFRGNEMSQTVDRAIEASKISVVIFSKGYASSVWCLDELVKILEHKNKHGQIVIPVFYRVYPSDVKNQTGIFGDSFLKVKEKRSDKLQRWRIALREATNLPAAFDSHVLRPDAVLIDKIVEEISKKLNKEFQEMGRQIERQESINAPGRRGRLGHDRNIYEASTYDKVVIEKIFVITNFTLEIFSAVFDQLSSAHKPQYALVSVALSFAALLLCILELVYRGRKEKVTLKWRSKLPWFYYQSQCHKPFGNLMDITGLICAVCQCIFTTISFNFVRQQADNPVKISAWPIVFASGLLCSKFLEKPYREEE